MQNSYFYKLTNYTIMSKNITQSIYFVFSCNICIKQCIEKKNTKLLIP